MDTIGNMLTAIRNAQAVKKETVVVPYSRLKAEIASIFTKEGFVKKSAAKGKKEKRMLEITLNYGKDGEPAISHIQRVSKSSRRVYVPAKKIYPVQFGRGLSLVSTPRGIMTNKDARKQKVGGEVLCEIW